MPNGSSILRIPAHGVEVTLDLDPTKAELKSSQFRQEGEYLHHVNGGQMLYLDPITHQNLLDLGARVGDKLHLEKLRRGNTSYVSVSLVQDAPAPAVASVKASAPVEAFTAAPAARPQVVAMPAPVASAATPAADEFPTLHRPASKDMAAAMCAAVDVALYVEAYARAKGRTLAFTTEDIRAMGVSLHISADRVKGVR